MQCVPGEQFRAQTVLLTGGLGFLGSVVLEQVLRLTEVEKVYLLVRSKKHLSAAQRVEKLLCSPLFNVLHVEARQGKRNVFTKVQAVEGDLSAPGLGLSDADTAAVQQHVNVVIHCAADIELDAHIHKTIKANYIGTQNLLQLCASMVALRAFLHTSTYFVNNWQKRNSVVKEQIYQLPLTLSSTPGPAAAGKAPGSMTHSELVEAVLAMSPEDAEHEVAQLMAQLNFNSNYAFGKYLTEQLFADATLSPGVSKAIVRPSLIAPVAGAPYPGYVAGFGGPAGYTMGYAVGFFHTIASVAFGSDYLMDLIPCDTVAALVVAAAAAAIQSSGSTQASQELQIYHAAAAQSHPCPLTLVFSVVGSFFEQNPPPLRLPFTKYCNFSGERLAPNPIAMTIDRWITQAKIYGVGWVLWAAGKSREAALLSRAFKAFNVYNSRRYDRSIVSAVDNVRALQARMPPSERKTWPIVWEESVMQWESYGFIALSGIRNILFKVQDENKTHLPLKYEAKKGADPSVLELHVEAGDAPAAAPAATTGDPVGGARAARSSRGGAADAAAGAQGGKKDQKGRGTAGKVIEVEAIATADTEVY